MVSRAESNPAMNYAPYPYHPMHPNMMYSNMMAPLTNSMAGLAGPFAPMPMVGLGQGGYGGPNNYGNVSYVLTASPE